MTRNHMITITIATLVGFLAACATGVALRPIAAQAPVPGQFHECIAGELQSARADDVNSGRMPQSLRVPSGWTPVGGGIGGTSGDVYAAVILCH